MDNACIEYVKGLQDKDLLPEHALDLSLMCMWVDKHANQACPLSCSSVPSILQTGSGCCRLGEIFDVLLQFTKVLWLQPNVS